MNRLRLVRTAVCIIFLSSVVLVQVANADWMFHAKKNLTGEVTG
jgi:hypothetical protein